MSDPDTLSVEEKARLAIRKSLKLGFDGDIEGLEVLSRACRCGFRISEHAEKAGDIILTAENSDEVARCIDQAESKTVAWNALRRIVKAFTDRQEALPAAIAAWNLSALELHRPRPDRNPVGPPTTTRSRNLRICIAVAAGVNAGLNATRNETTQEKDSACSLVAAELTAHDINLSERTVEGIWKDREFG